MRPQRWSEVGATIATVDAVDQATRQVNDRTDPCETSTWEKASRTSTRWKRGDVVLTEFYQGFASPIAKPW